MKTTTKSLEKVARYGRTLFGALALVLAGSIPASAAIYTAADDLPGPPTQNEVIPAGSIVIPMDNTLQSLVTPFNLTAYGLANDFLQHNIPLKWAIKAGKAKDGTDFTASAFRISPSVSATQTLNFAGGPFIVLSNYVAQCLPLIAAFGNNVAVYELRSNTTIDVRYDLQFRPLVAINPTNGTIHSDLLTFAGITNWVNVSDTSILSTSCYTLFLEPHNTDTNGVAAVKNYVQGGGNFLAQCASVQSYQNTPAGLFQSATDITIDNITNVKIFTNADLAFGQFIGVISSNITGIVNDWTLNSVFTNNGYANVLNANGNGVPPPAYAATTAKLSSGEGGMVFYLGGHDYGAGGTDITMINGQRMILNAIFIPNSRGFTCGFGFDPTPPTANPLTITVGGNTSSNIAYVLATDTDPEGYPLVVASVTQGAHGTASIGSSSTNALYSPNLGYVGTDTFTYVDSNNNGGNSTGTVTVIVLTPPTCSVSGSTNVCPSTTGNLYVDTTNAKNPTYSWSISGNGSIVGSATASNVSVTAQASGSYTVSVIVTATNGISTCQETATINDPTPTITECATNITGSVNGSCLGIVPNFTNAVVASDSCGGTVSITQSPLIGASVAKGTNTVTIKVANTHNGTNTCTASFIVIDNTLPSITCPATVTTNTTVGFCYAAGVKLGTPTTSDNCGVASVTNNAPVDFPVGTNTVTWTVTDTSGNTATCQQSVIVNDNQTPSITCPATVTTNTSAGFCSASGVKLGTPTTSAICGVATVTNNAPATFPVGTNTVTWTVTDDHGLTATCQQSVIVNDNQTPSITCPATVTTNTSAGFCYAAGVNLGTPVTSANCGVATVTNNAPATYPVGTNTVTWTVTDNHGLTATCQQSVIVNDNQTPSITCPATVTTNTSAGFCYAAGVKLGTPTTSANCGVASVTNNAPVDFPVGTNTVTWTVTDNHGLTATCQQSVIVNDNQTPSITCPATVTTNTSAGFCYAAGVNLGTPVTSANCGVATVTNNAPVDFPVGTNTVTWTVTDNHGLTATCQQSVIVNDNQTPSITCPATVTTNTSAGFCYAAGVNLGTPVTSANCGVATVTNNAPATYPVGTNTVTWTVTDNHGLTATCQQSVIVNDNQTPSITCPATVTTNTSAGFCYATGVKLGTPTTSANCGVASVTNNAPATYPVGTNTVTWTVTDNHGLTATCQQSVIVNDNQTPSITCPATVTTNTSAGFCYAAGVNLGTPTTSANCGVATVTNNAPATFSVGTNTVTWTVTDNHGLTATCQQSVIVIDNQTPSITCPVTVTTNTSAGFCYAAGVNLGTPVTSANCGVATVTNNAPVTYPVGTNTVTWTVTDNHGLTATCQQSVIVIDNQTPSITCPATVTTNTSAGFCYAAGVNLGTPVTSANCGVANVTNNAPVTYPVGTNTVTWTVTDNHGLTATCQQSVIVNDNQTPSITSPATVTTNTSAGFCYATGVNLGTPTTSANCGVASVTNNAPATYPVGTNTVTWTVTDNHGLTSTSQQSVIVNDNQTPSITCPATVTTNTSAGFCYATGVNLGTPVTSANCGVANVTNNAPVTYPVGTNTVTWTVTDNHGLTATCQQSVIVNDNQTPSITSPATVTTNTSAGFCYATGVNLGTPTTSANCGVASVTNNAPATYPVGTNTVTWTVTDNHGLTSTSQQSVIVNDNQTPSITCPATVTTNTSAGFCYATGVNLGTPVTSANCGVANVTNNAPATFPVGTNTVTWTVTDNHGLTATCQQSVIVIDNQTPSITCPVTVFSYPNTGFPYATGINLGTPTTSAACSVAGVTNNAPATYPIGTNTVTWTVTDTHGLTATCQQLVVISDNQPPTINCPPTVTTNMGLGVCSASGVNLGIPTASDVAGSVTITSNAPASFGPGTNTVTWTATNQYGLTATCQQKVIVLDNQSPAITAPATVTANMDNGACTASGVTLGAPVTSDNCGVASVTNNAPATFAFGTNSVTWTVFDTSGNTATATQTVIVVDNQPPAITCPATVAVATDPNKTTASNVALGAPVTSDNCSVAGVTNNAPATYPAGTNTVTWTVTDIHGNSNTCQQAVIVNQGYQWPTANPDFYTNVENTVLTVAGPGVLVNDTDPNGLPLIAVLDNPPANGTVVLNPDGSFVYTPNIGFYGTDTFAYVTSDGQGESGVAIATITVLQTNVPPVANDDSYATPTNTPLIVSAPGVLGNDTDADSNSLTAILWSNPSNGAVTLNADGSFTYTPTNGFVGIDSFTYAANDGTTDSAPATVTITVGTADQPPVAVPDTYVLNENSNLTVSAASGVLSNDVSVNPLTAFLVSGPVHGDLIFNADGSFEYTPDSNYSGADSFTYRATDGIVASSATTVSLTINPVDLPPVVNAQVYSTPQNITLLVETPGLLGNATDAEGNPLTPVELSSPANGIVTVNLDGTFTYVPNNGFLGVDTFTYGATDGTLTSMPATVTINVGPTNPAPVAVNDSYGLAENTVLSNTAPGVLTNDMDAAGNPLTALLVNGPANGTLTFNPDGSFVYTPYTNFYGADSFTYQDSDGTSSSGVASVFITVAHVNQPPVVESSTPSMLENTILIMPAPGALTGAFDPDGDVMTSILVSNPANGSVAFNPDGSYTYTPDTNFSGVDCFTFAATDGIATSSYATVCINVIFVDQPPVANNDSYTTPENAGPLVVPAATGVLSNDTSFADQTLTAIEVSGPTNGTLTLNGDGSFSYTPNTNFSGADGFTYEATDGTLTSGVATVSLTVTFVDQAPVANPDSYNAIENSSLTVTSGQGVLTNDTSFANQTLTAIEVAAPAHGTLTLNPNGSFTYTPGLNYNGPDSFTYEATDGTLTSVVTTVSITVVFSDQAPVANNDSYTTPENAPLSVNALLGVLANDTSFADQTLTAIQLTSPAHGALTLNTDGSFTYTANTNYYGADSFTYEATDGILTSGVATVSLTVTKVNYPPVAVPDSVSVVENSSANPVYVLANDSDINNDPLTVVSVTQGGHGSVSIVGEGASVTYTPNPGYVGSDSFSYTVSDGPGGSASANVSVTVTSEANLPVAVDDSYSMEGSTSLTTCNPYPGASCFAGVLANDIANGGTLTAILVTGPSHGTLIFNADGTFTYTPNGGYTGVDFFTYKCNNGFHDSNIATVTISIGVSNGANDADLYAKNAAFTIDWTSVNFDKFLISGQINPRGANTNLSGATMQISINGTNIFDPVTLDSKGVGSVTSGSAKIKARLNSSTGAYNISVTDADLRNAVGLPDIGGSGSTLLTVNLTITLAGLDVPEFTGVLQTPYVTTEGKTTKGRFQFTPHRTETGVFDCTKTRAVQLKDGNFQVSITGVIEGTGGSDVTPVGDLGVVIGSAGVIVPSDTATFALTGKHQFKFSADALEGTGIPLAGSGAATSYKLPITFNIPTANGTETYQTVIELKRTDGTSTAWKR